LAGLQATKHGGFYEMELDPQARTPARFQMHSIRW
jgi:hypothetical protein